MVTMRTRTIRLLATTLVVFGAAATLVYSQQHEGVPTEGTLVFPAAIVIGAVTLIKHRPRKQK